MYLAVILVVIVLVLFSIWCAAQRWRYRNLKYPGPKPIPVLGSALEFSDNPVEKINILSKFANKYNNFFKLWLGPSNVYLVVSDPKVMEFVLSSQKIIAKSIDYNMFGPWLGKGLLTATGGYWHKKRKLLTPAFHFKILEEFLPVFHSMSDIFVEKLEEKVGQGPIDIYPLVTAYTLDTICETAMGASVDAQNCKDNPYVRAVGNMRAIFIRRTFTPWKSFDTLFEYSDDYKLQKKSLEIIHGFTLSVIDKKKMEKQLRDAGQTNVEDDFGRKKRLAFLDLLLDSKIDGRDWTAEEIREEVDTFMFEGHDTTASAISFCLYELAYHQKVQEKVLKELDSIFGDDKNRAVTYQDLQDMKYLELVIKEVLRLYPSVPMFGRQVSEDIEYDGTVWPAGLNIVLYPFHMQRREDLFEDAMTFNPDRFLNDGMNKQNSFVYVPFSAGPRNCIGQKFAMMEMKDVLAKTVMNFKLGPGRDKYPVTELSGEAILKSEEGVYITVQKR